MKTHHFSLAILLLTFLITSNIKSQNIDSLKILPTNPTTTDTIKAVCYVSYPNSPCHIISSNINIIASTIKVYASHYDNYASFPAFCNSTDTLTIGRFSAGIYELIYTLLSDTAPAFIYDIDTIIFNIQQSTGMQLTENLNQEILIYPNPTTKEIYIELKPYSSGKHDISIYSLFGQKIKSIRETGNIITIDISDLIEGIYFIEVTNGQDKRWTQKIIKNAPQ